MRIAVLKKIWTLLLFLSIFAGCGDKATEPEPPPEQELPISGFIPLEGPAGTQVTISGEQFSNIPDSNIVTFGGVRGQVLTASDSELVAVVPRGALTGEVKVRSGGLTGIADESFTVFWTHVALPAGSGTLYDICWTGTQFVAVGTGGTIVTSPNGEDWTKQPALTSQRYRAVTSKGNSVLAVGDNGVRAVYLSETGWSAGVIPTTNPVDLAASSAAFVAIPAEGGYVLSSPDGTQWESHALDSLLPLKVAIYSDRFVVFSSGLPVFWSYDGGQWNTVVSNLTSPAPFAAARSGNRVMIAKINSLLTTTSVISGIWEDCTPTGSTVYSFRDLVWTGRYFLAVAQEAYWSTGGTGWRQHSAFDATSSVRPNVVCSSDCCVMVGSFGGDVLVWWFAE